jgi:hypothetical protein
MADSGDRCPDKNCKGRLHIRTSNREGDTYVQYLKCNVCNCEGGKCYTPAEKVWTRAG